VPKDLSQKLAIKTLTAQSRLRLKLNIQNVDQLLFFEPGDFAVLHGSPSVSYLASLLCVRAQLPPQLGGLGSQVVFVDGANSFNLYQICRLAQAYGLNSMQVLDRINIARAFTAYQMVTLIIEKLKQAVEKTRAKLAIVSDLPAMFLDDDIPEKESFTIYKHVLGYLSNFAKENNLLLIVTCPPHKGSPRNRHLQKVTINEANVVASLWQKGQERRIILEKHPRFVLGYALMPSERPKLTDFTENTVEGNIFLQQVSKP
jgi:predicted ATP-dependent serine protease